MPDQQSTWGDGITQARSRNVPDDQILTHIQEFPDLQPKIKQAMDRGIPAKDILNHLSALPKQSPSFGQRMMTAGNENLSHFVESGKGVIKGGLETIYDASKAAETAGTLGIAPYLEKKLTPGFHKQREGVDALIESKLKANNPDQERGKFAENVAELAIPGPDALVAGKSATVGGRMAIGAARGALDQGVRGFIKSGGDLKETAEQAAEGGVGGGIFNGLLPSVGGKLSEWGREQYAKILHPAGLGASDTIEKTLLPEAGKGIKGVGSMLDQGKTATGSLRGIYDKVDAKYQTAIKEMNDAYDALGPNVKVGLKPVITDFIRSLKEETLNTKGNFLDEDAEAKYKAGVKILKRLVQDSEVSKVFAEADLKDIRKWRQWVDKGLYKKRIDLKADSLAKELNEQLRNSVQDVIHSQHPTTEAVDAAVRFWTSAKKVLRRAKSMGFGKDDSYFEKATAYRASRIGATALIGGAVGEESSRRRGGDAGTNAVGAITGTVAGAALGAALSSTQWRSVSAVSKNNVAKWIAEGKLDWAANVARRALGWSILKTTPPPSPPKPPTAPQTTTPPSS